MTAPKTEAKPTGLELMRAEFPANQISKLPKPTKRDAPKGHCKACGGWHGLPAVHLDYVGHAALTARLLDCDPAWTWEPLAMHEGLPVLDGFGGMWIKLTVCGVTRLGYGHAGEKVGGDAIKEVIGDALRNAAMRFGAALELWHKGDLYAHEEEAKEPDVPAILRGISGSATVEVLKANYEAALQMLDQKHHETILTAKNARYRQLVPAARSKPQQPTEFEDVPL